MAWDWSSAWEAGLSGLGTGAATGSFFGPGLGTAIGAGIGGLGGFLLGGFTGGEDPTDVNPYSQRAWDMLMGTDGSGGTLAGYESQLADVFAQGTPTVTAATLASNPYMQGVQGFDASSALMDPTKANQYFLSQAPAFQQMAQQNFNWGAAEEQANRASSQAIKDIAGQFGNLGEGALRSGAAMSAISEGAINPLLQFENQRAQMVGDQAGALQNAAMGNINSAFNTAGQLGMQGQGLQLNALQSLMQTQTGRNALQAQLGQQANMANADMTFNQLLQQATQNAAFQQQANMANADMAFGQQQQQASLLGQLLGTQYAGLFGMGQPELLGDPGTDWSGVFSGLLDSTSVLANNGIIG